MAETKENPVKEQARMQLDGIVEIMTALETAKEHGKAEYDGKEDDENSLRERVQEDPLCVQVRSGWHTPGGENEDEDFRILLCTGGPAVQIRGELDEHGGPYNPVLQYQDWFTPWEDYRETTDEEDGYLLAYCREFYFGK